MTEVALHPELKERYKTIFEIDAHLDRLVQRIELLSYINPLNAEKEKHRFFASKYNKDPQFKYPKLKFDPYKLQQLFFSHRIDDIEDERIRNLYKEVIYFYSNMVQCIETIGDGKDFYYNSLRVYGTPTDRDVQNARFILHFDEDPPSAAMERKYTPEQAHTYFTEFAKAYSFPLNIRLTPHISADAMVSNSTRSMLLKRNTRFSDNQLLTLAHHEIGVHMVTTYNGLQQPLHIFSNGFPNNVETQEGLAVFSEYMGGALTVKRLKELSYRVLATHTLSKGYSFSDTFDLIHNQYKLNREAAFNITLRTHRGGGFTKDRLYLSGLRKIYKRYQKGKSLEPLLSGKVSMEYEKDILHLQNLGLSRNGPYESLSFREKKIDNPTLDFILNNLK
ncbi:MAG: flavohemoglobin expression-modulating QEGLA motif protein [Robiginitalea sp.]|uniref:flavohemoglobin expression-modulating QEGLA motif protein n=1 Tax=Robiginitalea sp. TaxID=1902411 RepID=UPI003C78C048